jgi:NDP-sugar pyrophosphorylase family protein
VSLTVAILCGGLGTRLKPLTNTMPKSLVEVAGVPFINYQLRHLASQGIERAVLCIGYRGGQIAEFVGSGQRFGLDVAYSSDGGKPLGTAGAIRKALPMLGSEFGVLYGDVFPLYSLQAVGESILGTGDAVMAIRSPGRGNVKYHDGRVLAYTRGSRSAYGDAGFSVLHADAFLHTDVTDLGDLFSDLAIADSLDGYEVTEPVYEVGSFEGLASFERYVLHDRIPV